MRLNLGCGTNRKQGYIGIDFVPPADVIHDLRTPLPYPDESVDAIFSSHVIEHFSRLEWERIRKDWDRILKPGGTIEVHCPDLDIVCHFFLENEAGEKWERWIKAIYGYQGQQRDIPGQFHKNGFTFGKLAADFPTYTATRLDPTSDYDLHVLLTKPDVSIPK